jgi:threonine synthase
LIFIITEKSFALDLICTNCNTTYSFEEKMHLCVKCSKVLFTRYDLEKSKEFLNKNTLSLRKRRDLWRFYEIMPVLNNKYRFSLGEGSTPVIELRNSVKTLKLDNVFLKDEGQNPTGTFKSRGLCCAVSKAIELGVNEFVIPTAGNAGAALSAYCAKTQSIAHIFMPKSSPKLIQNEIIHFGGKLTLIDGLISDAGKISKEMAEKNNWYDVSTLKEPYRVEGKKTMGLELAEQFDFVLPDAIVYPTGGGTGIIGIWKCFDELEQLGLINSERPKMISVQASNCAPIVKAFEEGKKVAETWTNAETFASGLRVPSAVGDYLILQAIRNSKGTAVAVSDDAIRTSMYTLAKNEGIMLSPEAGATVAALEELNRNDYFDKDEKIVLLGTGSGLTTPDEWE